MDEKMIPMLTFLLQKYCTQDKGVGFKYVVRITFMFDVGRYFSSTAAATSAPGATAIAIADTAIILTITTTDISAVSIIDG